jgi:hypothetical protein
MGLFGEFPVSGFLNCHSQAEWSFLWVIFYIPIISPPFFKGGPGGIFLGFQNPPESPFRKGGL